jgi:outer membrane lipoprotein-sorting protein
MRKRVLALALAGAFAATPAAAQDMTLQQLLEKHYEAIGGLDNWKDLQSFRASGTMSIPAQGLEAPFRMMAKRPNKIRIEFTIQGMTGVQAYDGSTAWAHLPFMNQPEPQKLPEDVADDLKQEADIDGPLIGYEEEGTQLELMGMEETEGTQAYKIKITRKNGDVHYYFLDAEHFVPIKIEGTQTQMGQEIQFETILSDYKEVGDVLMPYSIQNQPGGPMITLETIETNVPIEDSQFSMPKANGEGQ